MRGNRNNVSDVHASDGAEPSDWTLEMLAQQFMSHVESCDERSIKSVR
jgi:hypothetical protein